MKKAGGEDGEKLNKSVEKLLNSEGTCSARIKKLAQLLEAHPGADGTELVQTHYTKMYDLVLDTCSALAGPQDLQNLRVVMRRILVDCEKLVNTRWQMRSISMFCDRLLAYGNPKATRLVGFELSLLFLGALNDKCDTRRIQRLIEGLELHAFCASEKDIVGVFGHNSWALADVSLTVLPPTPSRETDSWVGMLELLFSTLSSSVGTPTFRFWFDRVFATLVSLLFPSVAQRARRSSGEGGEEEAALWAGFSLCPVAVQREFFRLLIGWLEQPDAHRVLGPNPDFMRAVLSLLGEPFKLPPSAVDVLSSTLTLHVKWLEDADRRPKHVQENYDEYIQQLLRNVGSLFQDERFPSDPNLVSFALDGWASSLRLVLLIAQQRVNYPQTPVPLGEGVWEAVINTAANIAHSTIEILTQRSHLSNSKALIACEAATRVMLVSLVRAKCFHDTTWSNLINPMFTEWLTVPQVAEAACRQWWRMVEPLITQILKSPSPSSPPALGDDTPSLPVRDSNTSLLASVRGVELSDLPITAAELKEDCTGELLSLELTPDLQLRLAHLLISMLPFPHPSARGDNRSGVRVVWCVGQLLDYVLDNSRTFKAAGNALTYAQRASLASLAVACLPHLLLLAPATSPPDLPPSPPPTQAQAVALACRVFTARGELAQLVEPKLPTFYKLVAAAASSPHPEVQQEVATGCATVFGLELPGEHVLVAPLLQLGRQWFTVERLGSLKVTNELAAVYDGLLTLSFSLVGFANAFEGTVPAAPDGGSQHDMKWVRDENLGVLVGGFDKLMRTHLTHNKGSLGRVAQRWLWGCTVLVREHLRKPIRDDVVETVWKNALHFILWCNHEAVARTAADTLVELTNALHDTLKAPSTPVLGLIEDGVAMLCAHLHGLIAPGSAGGGIAADALLWNMLQLCQELPATVAIRDTVLSPLVSVATVAMKVQRKEVKDAASAVLGHLCYTVLTFPRPLPLSPSVLPSLAGEDGKESALTLVRGNSVVSVCLTPSHKSPDPRRPSDAPCPAPANVVVRDCLSKHCWHVRAEKGWKGRVKERAPASPVFARPLGVSPGPVAQESRPALESVIDEKTMGWDEVQTGVLWWKLNPNHPFAQDNETFHTNEMRAAEAVRNDAPEQAQKRDDKRAKDQQEARTKGCDCMAARSLVGHLLALGRPHHVAHLGAKCIPLKDDHEKYSSVIRNVKFFDDARPRECHKIGVIYVPRGLEEQRSVLAVECGSLHYRAFVDGLGWQVPLSKHAGFNGKLDKHGSTGSHAPYHSDAMIEALFHVTSQMPSSEKDPQQIHKKRHVGNDQVQVVFSEHSRDYRPETITSQFNDVHVIVYPLSNNRYRVQTFTKKEVFGPLCDGMVIDRSLGAALVRRTAINADCMVRHAQYGHNMPYATRNKLLDDMVDKLGSDVTPRALVEALLQ